MNEWKCHTTLKVTNTNPFIHSDRQWKVVKTLLKYQKHVAYPGFTSLYNLKQHSTDVSGGWDPMIYDALEAPSQDYDSTSFVLIFQGQQTS